MRFPEFTEEWVNVSLKDVADFQKERISSGLLDESTYISTENILQNFQGVQSAISIPANTNVVAYKKNDILLSNIRPYLKKVWFSDRIGGCSADVFVLRSKTCEPEFLYNVIASDKFINYVMSGAKGVKMPRGDKNQMESFSFSIPAVVEQRKISRLFQLLDERIVTQNKIIEKYESLIQAIIYQKKTDGIRKGNWQKTELSEVLKERTEKNINDYTVCSVSLSQGVINQIEYLGRSFAAKETSHYNVVKYGDIVYTKSPTGDFPYGIVKRSYIKNAVAVSPLYGVYKPINDNIGVILHFYFMQSNNAFNYLHPLIQKGAKNTINITNTRFLENSIPLPKTENEAVYIANALTSIQTKIDTEKNLLRSYEKEKQYLLRQMFI
ncbi:restriction endonuclease subunit S [Bacteroides caccae]|uniref:restriction endonuclease subunit S n=1 Tax=Bacteroides caccae TaxID=47678 RepID=UPI0026E18350|nr:restriction endonuclease subunit S [Bacteroides caccae]MDO6338753.1 restriction endonuclease subunit S [Bacteroides caccae]